MSARNVIAALDPTWIAPPLLQPAALYLELSGEDIRARAFLVSDEHDLCLRPDMTVPAVRDVFARSATPPVIAYEGLVFRQQAAGSAREREFVQLGAEWLTRGGPEQDAAIIACALEACRAEGVEPSLRLGDVGIREGFIAACGLDEAWAARLRGALDHPERLDGLEDAPAAPADPFADAIAHLDAAQAARAFDALIARAQISPGESWADRIARLSRELEHEVAPAGPASLAPPSSFARPKSRSRKPHADTSAVPTRPAMMKKKGARRGRPRL